MAEKMKAYEVTERYGEGSSMVVFAPTKAKAMYKAFRNSELPNFMEFCCNYTSRRCKEADSQCNGREFMEWNNPDDRLFLVKELGWTCVDEPCDDCKDCIAHEFCDLGKNYIEEFSNG